MLGIVNIIPKPRDNFKTEIPSTENKPCVKNIKRSLRSVTH